MSYQVRFTQDAEADLLRLYEFILTKDQTDWSLASRALKANKNDVCSLELSPFSYRRQARATRSCGNCSFHSALSGMSLYLKSMMSRQ